MGIIKNTHSTAIVGNSYDIGNFHTEYKRDSYNRIVEESITGDINRKTIFTYIPFGQINEGKILTQTILEDSKKITYIFDYDSKGNITNTKTTTE